MGTHGYRGTLIIGTAFSVRAKHITFQQHAEKYLKKFQNDCHP